MKKVINILSIGNSFSVDAQCYLHDISLYGGEEVYCANLYIGGCSLETHFNNLKNNANAYEYHINGENTEKFISINDAVLQNEWDYITLQQVSGSSGIWDTYSPYLETLADFIHHNSKAKLIIHQTWAYETDSSHPDFSKYDFDQNKMYTAICFCYEKAAKLINAHMVIPSGELIQTLRNTEAFDYAKTGCSLCRDGFHLDLLYARYAVAALWYKKLTGESLLNNGFSPNGSRTEKINLIKETLERF